MTVVGWDRCPATRAGIIPRCTAIFLRIVRPARFFTGLHRALFWKGMTKEQCGFSMLVGCFGIPPSAPLHSSKRNRRHALYANLIFWKTHSASIHGHPRSKIVVVLPISLSGRFPCRVLRTEETDKLNMSILASVYWRDRASRNLIVLYAVAEPQRLFC